MKKLWSIIALLIIVLPILVACGDKDPTNTPEPVVEATKAPEVKPTEVVVEPPECTDPLGCVTVEAGEKLRIATALVISGPNETLGIDSQRGVEIAIAERGTVMGFEVELVAEDGQCSAEGG